MARLSSDPENSDTIRVTTNLDSISIWVFPEVFCSLPKVGDYIETNDISLKVLTVTHKMNHTIEIYVGKA
jgi:hypothetical protein